MGEPTESLPLPDDPLLALWASGLNEGGYWAQLLDANWRYVYETDDARSTFADMGRADPAPLGSHLMSAEYNEHFAAFLSTHRDVTQLRRWFLAEGSFALANMRGDHDELRRVVDPRVADLIDELEPRELPDVWTQNYLDFTTAGARATGAVLWLRIDRANGDFAGLCMLFKPAAGMSDLARAAATADLVHLERMRAVERPGRQPAAILMADLEASSPLARRLSSAQYFAFVRRLVRAADDCVIDAGGIVGRHAGDGVVAFFLARTIGSESLAAKACITAARALRSTLAAVAVGSELPEAELGLRFGLHWGSMLYVGRILTRGRSEVTALGDEMNEAARIEVCATGGRSLVSKALIERLDHADAEALQLDITRTTYTPLAELTTATDKVRRDAPSIAVCEI
jgi:class 3 adenylate cyclase